MPGQTVSRTAGDDAQSGGCMHQRACYFVDGAVAANGHNDVHPVLCASLVSSEACPACVVNFISWSKSVWSSHCSISSGIDCLCRVPDMGLMIKRTSFFIDKNKRCETFLFFQGGRAMRELDCKFRTPRHKVKFFFRSDHKIPCDKSSGRIF